MLSLLSCLAVPCPSGIVRGNDALTVRCPLCRRSMSYRGQKRTAKSEYGKKADNQLNKKTERRQQPNALFLK